MRALISVLALFSSMALAAAPAGAVVTGRVTFHSGTRHDWHELSAVGTWRAPAYPAFSERTKWVSDDANVFCGFRGTVTWKAHFLSRDPPPPRRDQLTPEDLAALRNTVRSRDVTWVHEVKIDEDASDLCAMFDRGGAGASLGLLRFDPRNGHFVIEPPRAAADNNAVPLADVNLVTINVLGERMPPPKTPSLNAWTGFFFDQGTWNARAGSAEGRWDAKPDPDEDPEDRTERWVTWSFTLREVELELRLELEPLADQDGHFVDRWEAWLPQGGPDEQTPGATLGVTASLVGKDGSPTQRRARFTFLLKDVSRQPGTCLNHPATGAKATPDLGFSAQKNKHLDVSAEDLKAVSREPSASQAALVSSYDWGAWGTLEVSATLDDGKVVSGRPVLLPAREAGSLVARHWRQQHGFSSEPDTWDGELVPRLDGRAGDGLTLYEEYRGLHARGAHVRLGPGKGARVRKLVVANEAGPAGALGLALLTRAAKGPGDAAALRVIDVTRDELRGEARAAKQVNFNFDAQTPRGGDQHGVLAVLAEMEGAATGLCVPIQGVTSPQSPKDTEHVLVSASALAQRGEAKFAKDLAHELAHALGVKHHGDKEAIYIPPRFVAGGPYRVFDTRGVELPLPYPARGMLPTVFGGGPQGPMSGDVGCLMHYDEAFTFAVRDGPGGKEYYGVPSTPPGDHLCTSPKGTGYNAANKRPPLFGDADTGRGNCLGQVRIKDW